MVTSQQFDFAIRVATVVVPVALYFLILGLLNSRRHPQMLSGRLDFTLLIAALSPLFVVPALHYVGISPMSLICAICMVVGGIVLLAPKGQSWVIYNAEPRQASRAAAAALRALGLEWTVRRGIFVLESGLATIHISSFPMLRNVSIRFTGPIAQARDFERELERTLHAMEAETSPSTVALLLVAISMMVAPLAILSNHAGEIVRILSGLLN